MSKKKLLIPIVLIVALGAAHVVMAKPQKAVKLKIQGTIYVMPQSFLLNLSEGHYAKLSVALDLAPGQSDGASMGRSIPPMPESWPSAEVPSMAWVAAPLRAESRRL